MAQSFISSDPVIDATDISLNSGSGGLGLGAGMPPMPAPGTDISSARLGTSGVPAFNNGSNLGASPVGFSLNNPTTLGNIEPTSASTVGQVANASGTAATNDIVGGTVNALSGDVTNYFVRGFVILVGMVFLAVGLNMLRPGTVPNVFHPTTE